MHLRRPGLVQALGLQLMKRLITLSDTLMTFLNLEHSAADEGTEFVAHQSVLMDIHHEIFRNLQALHDIVCRMLLFEA